MKRLAFGVLATGLLAGCQNEPTLPAKPGDLVPIADVQSAFNKGRRICYNYNAKDSSCTAVGRASGQNETGFSYRVISVNIDYTTKIVGNQYWLWKGDRWCEDVEKWRDATRSIEGYDLKDRYATVSESEQITQSPTMRAAIDEDRALADKPRDDMREFCFGWRLSSMDPWSATQVKWIDGVEQEGSNEVTVHLFQKGEAENLSLRYEKSESF